MRVAALYDIHGNLPALEAVLAEVEREGVDTIVFGGDIAAGRRSPGGRSSSCARCRTRASSRQRRPARRARVRGRRGAGLARRAGLDSEQADWLADLPFSVGLDDMLFCHATPRNDEEIVTPLTPDERLAEILAGVEQRPWSPATRTCSRTGESATSLLVNAGSVGLPYEGELRRFWALLDGERSSSAGRRSTSSARRAAFAAPAHPQAEELAPRTAARRPRATEAAPLRVGVV